jgi:hypothetical protein
MRLVPAEVRFLRTAGYRLWDRRRNKEIMKELHVQQITEFIEKYSRNWEQCVGRMSADRIPEKDFKVSTEREKIRETSETVEGLCHIMPVVRGLKRHSTGKDEDGNGIWW